MTAGNLFRTGCVFAGWTLLARELVPSALGVFALCYSASTLVAQLADSGLGVSVVKALADAEVDPEGTRAFVRLAFRLRLLAVGACAAVALAAAPWLTASLLRGEVSFELLVLALSGAVTSAYFTFLLTVNQGLRRFGAYAVLAFLSGGVWLAGLVVLERLGALDIQRALILSAGAFLVPALIGHASLPVSLWGPTRRSLIRREHLTLSGWTMVSGLLALVIMQCDTLLLGRLATAADVGVYSTAQRIAMAISVVSNSVLTVVAPRMMRSDSARMRVRWGWVVGVSAVGIPSATAAAWFAGPWLLGLLFGSRYAVAAPALTLLAAALLFSVVTNLLSYVGYGLAQPGIVTASLTLQLVLLLGAGILLAHHGATGMAGAVLLSRLSGMGLTAILMARVMRRQG